MPSAWLLAKPIHAASSRDVLISLWHSPYEQRGRRRARFGDAETWCLDGVVAETGCLDGVLRGGA